MTITDRIRTIIRDEGLTATSFADKLGVPRSGISHVFTGRYKPSLDLVLKIAEVFPHIKLDWLLLGIDSGETGSRSEKYTDRFERSEKPIQTNDTKDTNVTTEIDNRILEKNVTNVISANQEVSEKEELPGVINPQNIVQRVDPKTNRVILLLDDGTFREFLPPVQ
jgi:transcriptional regulator with XRE-family HTH domain